MTLPSVPIAVGGGGAGIPNFTLRGAALPVQVPTAVQAFVNVLKPFFKATTTFQNFTAFVQDDPNGAPHPVYTDVLNIVGTDAAAGWGKATQRTWTFRTDSFGLFKLVMLDIVISDFDRISTFVPATVTGNLIAYVTADVSWLAGRDGGRPQTFLQIANTLNEKLRRSYHMN